MACIVHKFVASQVSASTLLQCADVGAGPTDTL